MTGSVSREEGNRRLLVLADFLEKRVLDERFDYSKWVGKDWKGKPDLSCGTTACAFGWAGTIPEFQALGLHIEAYLGTPTVVLNSGLDTDGAEIRRTIGSVAAQEFFGLEGYDGYEVVNFLFLGGEYPSEDSYYSDPEFSGTRNLEDFTREEVIYRIRTWVKRNLP